MYMYGTLSWNIIEHVQEWLQTQNIACQEEKQTNHDSAQTTDQKKNQKKKNKTNKKKKKKKNTLISSLFPNHENTPIQIYRKFYHQKLKFFR